MSHKLQRIPHFKRPRERLVQLGADNLTDAELVAVILGAGTTKQGVLALAESVVGKYRQTIMKQEVSMLTRLRGIGQIQAGKLIAAVELGKRWSRADDSRPVLTPKQVLPYLAKLRQSKQEQLVGLYLNARYELLQQKTLAMGSLNAHIVQARDVFAPAIALPCAYVILAHNHPSGSAQPSQDDLITTEQLKKAGELLGITLLDHLIVTTASYCSMQELRGQTSQK